MLLNSCQRETSIDPSLFLDASASADQRLRPWRAFWPPVNREDPSQWSNSEFPSVCSWRFDPSQPFERPWRLWTRTSRAAKESAKNTTSWSDDAASVSSTSDNRPPLDESSVRDSCVCRSSQTKLLDADMNKRGFKTVFPALLYYLAPLSKYHTEKPYLSRLPSLPGFVRTNIVGCEKVVQIHEATGHEDLFTLDSSGFEFAKWSFSLAPWTEACVRNLYLPSLCQWLKSYLLCSDVHVYAYNVGLSTLCMPQSSDNVF